MQRCYTGAHIRAAEQPLLQAGHGDTLMRTAAWGLAHHTIQLLHTTGRVYGSRVIGLVGKGNNGADTLWALSFLAARGVAVSAIVIKATPDQLHAAALGAFHAAGGRLTDTIPQHAAAIIDGVFGTGLSKAFDLPGYLRDHELHIPADAKIIACDIASGVIADTGAIPGASLVADLTVTFGGPKVGLVAEAGSQHAGQIVVVDIGIHNELAEVTDPWFTMNDTEAAAWFTAPAWDAHKYSRGVLSVVAGSPEYPGAAVLVVNAAAATGVGYINLVAEPPRAKMVNDHVLTANPQAVVVDQVTDKASAVVVGPGLGDSVRGQSAAGNALQAGMDREVPVLVDASGLDVLEPWVFASRIPALILTPHVGEMQRLVTRLAPEWEPLAPADQAQRFARHFGVWVVLKSATTYVFAPDGLRSVHAPRTPELATAGTGDTLAGILGAGLTLLDPTHEHFAHDVFAALTAGVRLHSMAGELAAADGGVVVSSLADYIRAAKQHGWEH